MSQVLQTITLNVSATVTTPNGALSNATLNFGIAPQGSSSFAPLGSLVTDSNGLASGYFQISEEVPGIYVIQAAFAQTGNYAAASTTTSVDTTATQYSTSLTVTYSLLANLQANIAVNLTSQSAPISGASLSASLNGTPLSGTSITTDSNGNANFVVSGLGNGNNVVAVSFAGEVQYLPSSASTTITITPPPPMTSSSIGLVAGLAIGTVAIAAVGYVNSRKKR